MALTKSNLKLEEVRKYISHISGFFSVPFGDSGFLWTKEEIAKYKKEYDELFVKTSAMILGITPENVESRITKKNDEDLSKPYNWCWKHNLTYILQLKKDTKGTLSIRIDETRPHLNNIYFNDVNGFSSKIGNFYINENGEILQDSQKEYNSFDEIMNEILNELKSYKIKSITKELDKLKDTEKKNRKTLENTLKKITKLEKELDKLK